MKTLKKIERFSFETDKILCNMCGKECKKSSFAGRRFKHAQITIDIEEDSIDFLTDEYSPRDLVTFHLCEECLMSLIKQMKLPTGDVIE